MVAEIDPRIKLPIFEGPLDLLLFLIRKNEVDIYDIPIESVLRQYLDIIYAMGDLKLEVAGEFFVMAATLMEIKSRMLLPKDQQAVDPDAEEEEIDPRWELVHQLLQYKKFKEAATNIGSIADAHARMLPLNNGNTPGYTLSERPLKPADKLDVWNAFNVVLRRLAEKITVGEIADERVTVVDQMEAILERTRTEPTFRFSSLIPEKTSLRLLVVTFLAVLELVRLKRLAVAQDEAFADISCTGVSSDSLKNELENPSI